ncbi:MAG TPA: rRNA maturation RNase YbeY [Vicinamibacterales bacterium]
MPADDPDPSPRRAAVPGLIVSLCDAAGAPVRVPGLARWLSAVAPRSARGTVTLVLASDRRMRTLNRTWRGVDQATDVLSFPAADPEDIRTRRKSADPVPHLGDIVIARGVAARQAQAAGHSPATELRVLALHGLLHLLGYDHDRDSGQMARLERRLRRKGGLREGLIERAPRVGGRARTARARGALR